MALDLLDRVPINVEFMLSSKIFRILTSARRYLERCAAEGARPADGADRIFHATKPVTALGDREIRFMTGSPLMALYIVKRNLELTLKLMHTTHDGSYTLSEMESLFRIHELTMKTMISAMQNAGLPVSLTRAQRYASSVPPFLHEMMLLAPGAPLSPVQLESAIVVADYLKMYERQRDQVGPIVTTFKRPVHPVLESIAAEG